MLARLRAPAATLARAALSCGPRRFASTGTRADGFNEALPRRDIVAPLVCAGAYGLSWWCAEEGTVKGLVEGVELNTDPEAWPTPKQVAGHLWPFLASTLAMVFESVACKFARTDDMRWLCTAAMQDEIKVTVALCLLVAPAEHSPAFARAICDHGAMNRLKEIFTIYQTFPREQHDEVLTHACIIGAKVAASAHLRQHGFGLKDFVWMMPEEKAHINSSYTAYGVEGLGHLWQRDLAGVLTSGGVARVADIMAMPFSPGGAATQEMANRLMGRLIERKSELLAEIDHLEKSLEAEIRSAGPAAKRKTIWQATGVHRGETEAEVARRERRKQLDAVRSAREVLQQHGDRPPQSMLEQHSRWLSVASAAALGFVYGGMRGYVRGFWQDVTPSVCRELALHVSRRTALGCAVLVAVYEAAPQIRTHVLEAIGKPEVTDYNAEGALEQLCAVDAAYLGLLAVVNFCFPYVLLPVAFNPIQLLLPPNDVAFPHAADDSQKKA